MSPSSREGERPRVSVLVLSWNTKDLTLACCKALCDEEPRHAREVLCLDNGSRDASAEAIAACFPAVRLERSAKNLGYAAGNNRLARLARGEFLCLLGSDTEVRPGAIDTLVDFLESRAGYGAAAPRLVGADGSLQKACMRWPTLGVALVYDMFYRRWPFARRIDDRYFYRDFDHAHDADVLQPPGTCLLIRRALWEELGGMDEELWLFFNDVDLCRRIHARGRAIRYLEAAEVMHHHGASTQRFDRMVQAWARDRLAYYRKHYGRLGSGLVRLMIRARAAQEWWALGRRHPNPQHRRDARAELRRVVKDALSTKVARL